MEKISLFTSSDYILNRWKEYLDTYDLAVIKHQDELLELKNNLLIFSTDIELKYEEVVVSKLLKNTNKVLVLDSSPKLEIAHKWLSLGVDGYGNTLMSKIYLNSCVESISNGLIWIVPEITIQLIKELSKEIVNNDEMILSKLTKTEKQIALLLKSGYSNYGIGEELKISINTVKTHIKSIYLKLGVNDRVSFIHLFVKDN